jgi:hypothetical protein
VPDAEVYIDSVALNLHGFYSGVERLLELIASQVDEAAPEGGQWHRELLERLSQPIAEVRPAVLQAGTVRRLGIFANSDT